MLIQSGFLKEGEARSDPVTWEQMRKKRWLCWELQVNPAFYGRVGKALLEFHIWKVYFSVIGLGKREEEVDRNSVFMFWINAQNKNTIKNKRRLLLMFKRFFNLIYTNFVFI